MKDFFLQFLMTLQKYRTAYDFIREHRPWEGFQKYKTLIRWTSILAIIIALVLLFDLISSLSNVLSADEPMTFQAGLSSFYQDFVLEDFKWIFSGGPKYLILILVEVLIFHFTNETICIQTGIKREITFKMFVAAEIRMVKIALRSWIMEIVVIALLGVALGIFGLDFLEGIFGFLVQSYFIGFALIDNYNETYKASIKESAKVTRKYAGVAVAVGLVVYILMYIPLIGVLAASLFGAVTATLMMHQLNPCLQFEKIKKPK